MKSNAVVLFGKAQVAALSGGLLDYFLMILLTELTGMHYTVSILVSGSLGAYANFSINRKWVFKSGSESKKQTRKQAMRFAIVVLGSVMLKSAGTFMASHLSSINYKWCRILVDLCISYSFNFPLIKYWVFEHRKKRKEEHLQLA